MKPLVVVPTYNERANIRALLPRILAHAPGASVLVVDDGSPDGTAAEVRRQARRRPERIRLLSRPSKRGLGTAYVAGFRFALRGPWDAVVQMDADGSHDPAALPSLLARLRTHDGAVGTRYANGTRVMNWPWGRLLLSLGANRYARAVTGVPLTDLTGGYNAWRADILRRVGPESLRSNGYAFQIELKARCWRLGGRLAEVPIVFTGRVEGESKLSRAVMLEAAVAVWRMRFSRR